MIKYLRAACIALAAIVYSSLAMAQAPCQWNYSFVNNVATATYCGNISGSFIGTVPLADIIGMDATAQADLANPSNATGGMSTYNGLQIELGLYAPLASPTFTGAPKAPTQTPGDTSTDIATDGFVANAITGFAPLASPTFTGAPKAPTQTTSDTSTDIATDAFVHNVTAAFAPLASPALTGAPTAPTQTAGDNSTNIATTAYVATAVSAGSAGQVLLATLTASNSPTLQDTTHFTNTYSEYEIVFENVVPVSSSFACEVLVQEAGAFQTTGYLDSITSMQSGGGSTATHTSTNAILCSGSAGTYYPSTSGQGESGHLHVSNVASTALHKIFWGQVGYTDNGSYEQNSILEGQWNGGNGAITGIEILFSSGNIASGIVKIYGYN